MLAWTMIEHKVTNMIDRNKQGLIFICYFDSVYIWVEYDLIHNISKLKSQQTCPPADCCRDLIILLQILQRIS